MSVKNNRSDASEIELRQLEAERLTLRVRATALTLLYLTDDPDLFLITRIELHLRLVNRARNVVVHLIAPGGLRLSRTQGDERSLSTRHAKRYAYSCTGKYCCRIHRVLFQILRGPLL